MNISSSNKIKQNQKTRKKEQEYDIKQKKSKKTNKHSTYCNYKKV